MFDRRQWVYYNVLISLLVLILQESGSKAEDFLLDSTFEPDTFVPFRLQTFTTESTFNGEDDIYRESGNLYKIGSKSNVVNAQKLHNVGLYKDDALDESNQLRHNTDSFSSSSKYRDRSPVEYMTKANNNHSDISEERIMNHKMTGYSAFEKHKAHHRNYRRYGHKSHNHKKKSSKHKKYEYERYRAKQKFNGYNRQPPYYQGQLSYYSESDGVDNSFEYPIRMRNHRYHHHNGHHNGRTDQYNQNSKWPHLSRVQYQLYEDEKDDDLPPYIKKYKRRNKQLLDLLEGTMPPPPPLQSTESSVVFKKRKKSQHHYHNHKNPKWIMEDLFEEQKANPNNPSTDDDQYMNDAQSIPVLETSSSSSSTHPPDEIEDEELKSIRQNELPGDNISISSEEENKNQKQNINIMTGKKTPEQSMAVITETGQKERPDISSKTNKFIYHRVDASPRVVGAGIGGSKKQRLPFVAITDRRLETSKTRQRNFEQNHLPMP